MGEYKKIMIPLLPVVVLALLGLAAVAEESHTDDAEVKALVAKVIEAYGGEDALRSITGFYAKGRQWAEQTHQMIQVQRWFGRPDKLHLELAYPSFTEVRFTDGEMGWAGPSADEVRPANALKLQAMRLQTARFDLPLRLLEHEDEIERRDPDADDRIVLRLAIDDELYLDYHIDPEKHRIERITMSMPGPPAMEFSADYTQFHTIEGVLIPFREITFAGSTVTSRFQVINFEWNPDDLESELRPGLGAYD